MQDLGVVGAEEGGAVGYGVVEEEEIGSDGEG